MSKPSRSDDTWKRFSVRLERRVKHPGGSNRSGEFNGASDTNVSKASRQSGKHGKRSRENRRSPAGRGSRGSRGSAVSFTLRSLDAAPPLLGSKFRWIVSFATVAAFVAAGITARSFTETLESTSRIIILTVVGIATFIAGAAAVCALPTVAPRQPRFFLGVFEMSTRTALLTWAISTVFMVVTLIAGSAISAVTASNPEAWWRAIPEEYRILMLSAAGIVVASIMYVLVKKKLFSEIGALKRVREQRKLVRCHGSTFGSAYPGSQRWASDLNRLSKRLREAADALRSKRMGRLMDWGIFSDEEMNGGHKATNKNKLNATKKCITV